jgi:hypothetical protein
MRNWIWNYILKNFKTELWAYTKEYEINKANSATRVNYPLGQKVIFRSNEPGDLAIGPVVQHLEMHGQIFLVIKDEKTQEEVLSLDKAPSYWTENRETVLNKLNWCEQWTVLSKYMDMDENDRIYKESPEYQARTNNFGN